MSQRTHSPLPWHHFENCEGHSINDADGHHVAYTDWDSDAFNTEDAPADHNAAFIVHACNLHARLVKALGDLLGDRPDIQSGSCVRCGRDYRQQRELQNGCCPSDDCPAHEARAVLAEANKMRS